MNQHRNRTSQQAPIAPAAEKQHLARLQYTGLERQSYAFTAGTDFQLLAGCRPGLCGSRTISASIEAISTADA
jgi:hypothetical protein